MIGASVFEKLGFRVVFSKSTCVAKVEAFQAGRGCAAADFGDLTLLYLGEVLDHQSFLTAAEILNRFRASGPDCLRDFDGSFLLVLMGGRLDSPLVVTDPLNSMKCFVEETEDSLILVSSLCFLPDRPRAIDRIGVASFLANGVIYNHRTLFEGVRSLPRASVHTIGASQGICSQPYWEYRFTNQFADASRQELKEKLAELLLNAARKRIRPSETIFLSLSGGYDSTCILGLLSKLAPGRVECFSYVVNHESQGSDEQVASQMARIAGFPHASVNLFDGDSVSLIRRNAAMGECRANFCGELDAWEAIRARMDAQSVFFVGDECFGWNGCRLDSEQDVLASIPIHPSSVLSQYSDCIDTQALGEGYDKEVHQFTAAAQESDLHNTKDFLYLDQRLSHVILPWRELFAGRFAPVRNLLLDRDILSFMAQLPSRFRLGKNLYKETVRMMFPELFQVRRAYKPASDPIKAAIFAQRDSVIAEFLSGTCPVDEWIKPANCAKLIPPTRPLETFSFKARAILHAKKTLKESFLAHSLKNFLRPKPLPAVNPLLLLLRVVVLRKYIANKS